MTNGEGTLDDVYLEWLYGHIASVESRNPERSYWKLALQLYTTPFKVLIINDKNREEDGKELRSLFLEQTKYSMTKLEKNLFMDLDCSMLELIIAISDRLALEMDERVEGWFWRLMHNLGGFERYSDDLYEISIQEEVDEALNRVIWRTYSADGTGGLFPLRRAEHDQRKIELWFQMSAYILEGLYVHATPQF